MNSMLLAEAESVLNDEFAAAGEVDLVEEMRLRTWARRNYVSAPDRDGDWHPVILDEMTRIDDESLLE